MLPCQMLRNPTAPRPAAANVQDTTLMAQHFQHLLPLLRV